MARYTIELTADITSSLYSIAHKNGISVAEAMRRAFAFLEIAHNLNPIDRIGIFAEVGNGKLKVVSEVKVF